MEAILRIQWLGCRSVVVRLFSQQADRNLDNLKLFLVCIMAIDIIFVAVTTLLH